MAALTHRPRPHVRQIDDEIALTLATRPAPHHSDNRYDRARPAGFTPTPRPHTTRRAAIAALIPTTQEA